MAGAARNIELKVQLDTLAAARQRAIRLATETLGRFRQTDTYFGCPCGRLKLREVEGRPAQLIWYVRPDQPGPKPSEYVVVPVADPGLLKVALAGALGVRATVDKDREVFLVDGVRVHLDQVRGLGTFLEFEAVVGPDLDDEAARSRVNRLAAQFGLDPHRRLASSYADLLGRPE